MSADYDELRALAETAGLGAPTPDVGADEREFAQGVLALLDENARLRRVTNAAGAYVAAEDRYHAAGDDDAAGFAEEQAADDAMNAAFDTLRRWLAELENRA